MKKTLLATAIAGALGASAAAQAATVYNQDGTQLDIYGDLNYAYKSVEEATYNANGDFTGVSAQDGIDDNGSTLGFTGQHVINAGVTAYFDMQFDVDGLDEESFSGMDVDQAFIGAKGSFGDVRLGSWDDLIDDWVQDPITNNETFDLTDGNGLYGGDDGANTQENNDREGDKIQYLSPSFNGLQFAVGAQYKGDAEGGYEEGSGDSFGENIDNSGNAAFYGGVKYEVGAFSVAAVYDNLANYDGEVTGSTYQPVDLNNDGDFNDAGESGTDDFEAGDTYGVTFQYTIDALRLAAKYERYESGDTTYLADENRYALGARYGYGFGDVYGAYQYVDVGGSDLADTIGANNATIGDNDDSRNEIVLGATYNITSSLYTFAEAAWYDRESDAGDGVAVGAVYAF
ncbi:porin [Modicisalibacter luteus]|uniref:Porin n=1 Tax=Modicisalibacter luteus TaxID=453962 RepID=A0ABV7LZT9_9GAMM|nr:porin [Halomonas lutea]GHA95275.1 porin [Halomonas lutea]